MDLKHLFPSKLGTLCTVLLYDLFFILFFIVVPFFFFTTSVRELLFPPTISVFTYFLLIFFFSIIFIIHSFHTKESEKKKIIIIIESIGKKTVLKCFGEYFISTIKTKLCMFLSVIISHCVSWLFFLCVFFFFIFELRFFWSNVYFFIYIDR